MVTRVTSRQSAQRLTIDDPGLLDYQVERMTPESPAPKLPNGGGLGEYLSREILFSPLFLLATMVYITAARVSRSTRSKSVRLGSILAAVLKRAFDIVSAAIGLVLTLPIFMVVAILIKLESPGAVIFTQLRVGKNSRRTQRRRHDFIPKSSRRKGERRRQNLYGRPFVIYKFRTMREDAEKFCGPVWATKNDPRITKVGKTLRMTRLDELPQLFNVLKGDMSLVGPRPERPYFVRQLAKDIEGYSQRLETKPGITGLAQISQGYDANLQDVGSKVKFDLAYIRNWSLWFDLKIIAKTVVVMLTGKGM